MTATRQGSINVAIDVTETCRESPTGCGQFTAHVGRALLQREERTGGKNRFTFHYRASHRKSACHAFCPSGHDLHSLSRFAWTDRSHADIIHGFATHAPRLGSALRIVTLFDVFSTLEISKDWQSPASRRRKIRQYRRLAQSCDLIIAISETTKRDFLRSFDYPEDRIRVIYGGVDTSFSPSAGNQRSRITGHYALPERYFLYVGAPIPRKNVDRLIDAYSRSLASETTGLVIAGAVNHEARRLIDKIEQMDLAERIVFAGYVPAADLPALYACAEAFLFPTFYEGLGMPVLEAMACGTPVLIGNQGAAPEIAGSYAVQVDPRDTQELARAIDRLADTEPGKLDQAREHAIRHTWQACADATYDAYQWTLARRRTP